jgi:hypothetical protein
MGYPSGRDGRKTRKCGVEVLLCTDSGHLSSGQRLLLATIMKPLTSWPRSCTQENMITARKRHKSGSYADFVIFAGFAVNPGYPGDPD